VVLHEVFTGKRPSTDVTHPDLSPDVDRVIRRCLADDPAKRPASALQVAEALAGGDPLAAALAAGETPSPEMVAAAGQSERLHPAIALACLAGIIISVIAVILMGAQTMLYRRVPLEKPPDALAERARNILQSVGYPEPPVDTAMGFYDGNEFLRYITEHDKSKKRWDNLDTDAFVFWYRGSPRPLESHDAFSSAPRLGFVWTDAPPLDVSGMTLVRLNPLGRLTQLIVVPPQVEKPAGAAASSADWTPLFSAAGLDPSNWTPTHSTWTPPVYADARAAWTGALAERPPIPMRIEAAAYRGKAVYFELIGPWTRPGRMQPYQPTSGGRAVLATATALFLFVLVGSALLARRNLRLGRGDRRGANRVAAFVFVARGVEWFFYSHHVPNFDELSLFMEYLVWAVAISGGLWMLYIALEPYVRRHWPATLVSWSRLLAGGFWDPVVGRDILAGCVVGASTAALETLGWFVPAWLGFPPVQPRAGPQTQFLGTRTIIGDLSNILISGLFIWLGFLFALVVLRALLRKEWAAGAAFVLLMAAVFAPAFSNDPGAIVSGLVWLGLAVFLLIRFGLLAGLANAVIYLLLRQFPLTFQGSAWYAGISLAVILLMAALALYSFYTSLGGRPIFGRAVLEE
jgi:serine/threonine-protein kinase